MKASETGGVNPLSIGGRMIRERERLIGMTPEERAWRARFLKSQELAPDEPINSPEYYKEYYNPIRRLYRAPLNVFEKALNPLLGNVGATCVRLVTGRIIMSVIGLYCGWYYFKYHKATWVRQSGWRFAPTREELIPGSEGYKGLEKPEHFATYGFENSPI